MNSNRGVELETYIKEIIAPGDENGNGRVVRFQLPSGLEIIGLPTKNFYGGHWDLGPTWNYVVLADKPFLVDAGRFGQGKKLVGMMQAADINPADLAFVLISHGHEDHDGGLAELVKFTQLKIKAHGIYERLIRKYPENAPPGPKEDFPAKCWHCFMPESFYTANCLGYHRVLQELEVDVIGSGENELMAGIRSFHLPGHSPDCLALLLGNEAMIVGDIVLPDISPWPTCENMFDVVAPVLQPHYTDAAAVFGLECYIKSLKKLREIAFQRPDLAVFPAHRIYYGGQWNGIDLVRRVDELIAHHVQRCGAILDILKNGPKTDEQIAREHFGSELLEGFGSLMAATEVVSHCELLMKSGDITILNNKKYAVTGSKNFETHINGLKPEISENVN